MQLNKKIDFNIGKNEEIIWTGRPDESLWMIKTMPMKL